MAATLSFRLGFTSNQVNVKTSFDVLARQAHSLFGQRERGLALLISRPGQFG